MPGDGSTARALDARTDVPRSSSVPDIPRSSLLNPLYQLVCELAATRGCEVPPLGRLLSLPLGGGWWADLSTDCANDPDETMLGNYGLRLRNGTANLYVAPFTPERVDPSGLMERRLLAAIVIAELHKQTGIEEGLLLGNVAALARSGLGERLLRSSDPLVQQVARAASLLEGIA